MRVASGLCRTARRPPLSGVAIIWVIYNAQFLTRGLRRADFSTRLSAWRRLKKADGREIPAIALRSAIQRCDQFLMVMQEMSERFSVSADRFGLVAVEPGEAGAEQLPVALGDHRFGERIGLAEQAAGLVAGGIEALPGLAFALQRADLDDPAGVDRGGFARAVLRRPVDGGGGWIEPRPELCDEAGTLEAGSTPSRPCPVPWFAGCGGISVLAVSGLGAADRAGRLGHIRSGRWDGVGDGRGGLGAADASLIWPALTWTVLTRTGFIGSEEPGMAAIAWVWITPLVNGAGSGFCGCGATSEAAAAVGLRAQSTASGADGPPAPQPVPAAPRRRPGRRR